MSEKKAMQNVVRKLLTLRIFLIKEYNRANRRVEEKALLEKAYILSHPLKGAIETLQKEMKEK